MVASAAAPADGRVEKRRLRPDVLPSRSSRLRPNVLRAGPPALAALLLSRVTRVGGRRARHNHPPREGAPHRTAALVWEHSRTVSCGEPGWPWPWSEPTRCVAGTRSERFIASPSVPVILQAGRSTGGPRAPDHCRYWKPLGDAAAEGYERRARSRRAERARAGQACRGNQASGRHNHPPRSTARNQRIT